MSIRCIAIAAWALVVTYGFGVSAAVADITYAFDNYAAFQNGYTISGSITTDGVIGLIQTNDIISWNITVSSGSNAIFSLASGQSLTGMSAANLEATSTTLSLAATPPSGLSLFFDPAQSGQKLVLWVFDSGPSASPPFYVASSSYGSSLWNASDFPVSDPIATAVPEPSTCILAGLAGVVGIGYAWRRRRRMSRAVKLVEGA